MRRYRLWLCLSLGFPLLLWAAASAQEADFPTLDAIARLDIPAYDYGDTIRRYALGAGDALPPIFAAGYQLGNRETFHLQDSEGVHSETVLAELRSVTPQVLLWVQASAQYSHARAMATAQWAEARLLTPVRQLLGYRQPPGIDGDPRLTILLIDKPGFWARGYFDSASLLPRALLPNSNEREMLVANLARRDGAYRNDADIRATIAHEYQHNLMRLRDANEAAWLDEGLAVFFEQFSGAGAISDYAAAFLAAPNTSLKTMYASADVYADFGAAGLFIFYLAERFGEGILARLHAESADGWRAVQAVLRGYDADADAIFADWALANYLLDAERGYGYRGLDASLQGARPAATLSRFPAAHQGSLPQYSSEYLALELPEAAALSLRWTAAPLARLIDSAPAEGDFFYYAATADNANSRLTRAFDLSAAAEDIWLEFKIWHDLVAGEEWAQLAVSRDAGASWRKLNSRRDRSRPDTYSGYSGGWLQESISLAEYRGERIQLRFEVFSRADTRYRGLAIDDLRLDAIGFRDGFEAPDAAWNAEGWLRTDNRLPNRAWLQVLQEAGAELELTRQLMTGAGALTVPLRPGARRAHIAISPIVPLSAYESAYQLDITLLDAAGQTISGGRDCQLRATHGLNFRETPGGLILGLLPQGTEVSALAREGDWYQVEYGGETGWIHAGYVTRRGDCA